MPAASSNRSLALIGMIANKYPVLAEISLHKSCSIACHEKISFLFVEWIKGEEDWDQWFESSGERCYSSVAVPLTFASFPELFSAVPCHVN